MFAVALVRDRSGSGTYAYLGNKDPGTRGLQGPVGLVGL